MPPPETAEEPPKLQYRLRVKLRSIKDIPEPAPLLSGDGSGWGDLLRGRGVGDGTRDPYVEFRLLNATCAEAVSAADGGGGDRTPQQLLDPEKVSATKTSRKVLDDCNPEWKPAQVFEWELDAPDTAELEVVLQDWDRFWSDMVLSTATFKLKPFKDVAAGGDHSVRLISIDTGEEVATTVRMDVLLMEEGHFENIVTQRVFENQRYSPILGWSSEKPGSLRDGEERWVYVPPGGWGLFKSGPVWSSVAPPIPEGFVVADQGWHLEIVSHDDDEDGWMYASDFDSHVWFSTSTALSMVRRRVHAREVTTRKPKANKKGKHRTKSGHGKKHGEEKHSRDLIDSRALLLNSDS